MEYLNGIQKTHFLPDMSRECNSRSDRVLASELQYEVQTVIVTAYMECRVFGSYSPERPSQSTMHAHA